MRTLDDDRIDQQNGYNSAMNKVNPKVILVGLTLCVAGSATAGDVRVDGTRCFSMVNLIHHSV